MITLVILILILFQWFYCGNYEIRKISNFDCLKYYQLTDANINEHFLILKSVKIQNVQVEKFESKNIIESDTSRKIVRYDLNELNKFIDELCTYINYFDDFQQSINWIISGWIAHELGHQYFNNINRRFRTNREEEDECDVFAGNLLRFLHADSLQATMFINSVYNIDNFLPSYKGKFDMFDNKYSNPRIRKQNYLRGWRNQ